jgi:hypothetical protein
MFLVVHDENKTRKTPMYNIEFIKELVKVGHSFAWSVPETGFGEIYMGSDNENHQQVFDGFILLSRLLYLIMLSVFY